MIKCLWISLAIELSSGLLAVPDKGAPRAELGARELLERLRDSYQRTEALDVTYEMSNVVDSAATPATAGAAREDFYLRRRVVFHRPDNLLIESAHGSSRADPSHDWHRTIHALSDRALIQYEPLHRVWKESTVDRSQALPSTLHGEFLFVALGLWPLDNRAAPRVNGAPYMVTDLVADPGYRVVHDRQRSVAGIWCHVVEKTGADVLSLRAQGEECFLMRRETYDSLHGALMQDIRLEGHRRLPSGIRIPGRIVNVQYDYRAPTPELRRRKVVHSEWKLIEVGAGVPPDRVFHPAPPPGAVSIGADGIVRQIAPGGRDLMVDVVAAARGNNPMAGEAGATWPRMSTLLVSMAAILVALVMVSRIPDSYSSWNLRDEGKRGNGK
jgi:hypothetical protein